MQFTKKEIELAEKLKKSGLEWVPQIGDWFYVTDDAWELDTFFVSGLADSDILSWFNDEMHEFKKNDCVWLPLWHQGREALAKKDYFIGEHYDSTNIGKVSLWIGRKGVPNFVTNIKHVGDTDLEVIYIALLEVFRGEN